MAAWMASGQQVYFYMLILLHLTAPSTPGVYSLVQDTDYKEQTEMCTTTPRDNTCRCCNDDLTLLQSTFNFSLYSYQERLRHLELCLKTILDYHFCKLVPCSLSASVLHICIIVCLWIQYVFAMQLNAF